MEEIKTIGIVAGTEDYKEADKLVKIFTPEMGVIRAVLKGVKKSNAKLKFAGMTFSFCEFELIKRGSYYSIKTAAPIESLYAVTSSPEKYICASVMLECCTEVARENYPDCFVSLLTAIKELIYSDDNSYIVALRLLNSLLKKEGYFGETEREREFFRNIDNPNEKTLSIANLLLKRYVAVFERNIICKIKSADLI